eukprot:TRINITY_DN5616_c0_g1_i1.p1 TRINITY_DN5616_c0_g1~~TRINITY_DN5616_c0_g1_i1.p1  ORF type:complete len:261 (+),score=41.07 TRINITY_DN5616_c0_g1_i1:155-937(+)
MIVNSFRITQVLVRSKTRKQLQFCQQIRCVNSSDEVAIKLKNVSVNLGEGQYTKQVLKGVNFTARKGNLHMVVGPNGSGKSTLLRVLGGLVQPKDGSVTVNGEIGWVFQDPDHSLVMPTVSADVAFSLGGQDLSQSEIREKVDIALEAVRMQDCIDRPIHSLSGGQKQRVAIAGALISEAQILLLDELTTFLDPQDQFSVLETVKNLVGSTKGVTAIWVTHRLEELEYADRISVVGDGKIVASGSPQSIQKFLVQLGAQL